MAQYTGPVPADPSHPLLPDFIPYWSWNRLESRPRRREFKNALKAEIHDATWMIGRQWQMGEFKGNDTGTGILARASMDYFAISGMSLGTGSAFPYAQEVPIEAVVEPILPKWSIKERILIGNKWLYALRKTILNTTLADTYKQLFTAVNALKLNKPVVDPIMSPSDAIDSIRTTARPGVADFIGSCDSIGINLDGARIYQKILSASWDVDLANLFSNLYTVSSNLPDAAAITADLSQAKAYFLDWIQRQYSLPAPNNAWNRESLEYQFATEWNTSNGPIELKSHSYQNRNLDWYSLHQSNDVPPSGNPEPNKTVQIIMTRSRFPGMPNSRWWEMENGRVNFCAVNADTTDVAKILATQFALVYQDDWFVIPYKVPVGTFSSVNGIVVTDVFGITTFISDYTKTAYDSVNGFSTPTNDQTGWRWMNIASLSSDTPAGKQVILPVTHRQQQSEPIEEVSFMRDELADLVWAIEKTIPDELGSGMDGFRFSNVFIEKLKQLKPSTLLPTGGAIGAAPLDYKLSDNNVPENCIPFVPVHVPNSSRSIRFQRAALPRILENYPLDLIRPNTSILKTFEQGQDYEPYYINEEEISKSGTIVQTRFQRARWYNGRIVSWLGYLPQTGRGIASSGLHYDILKERED